MILNNSNLAIAKAKTVFNLAWKRATALKCIPKYVKCQAERTKILGIYLTCQQRNMENWNKKTKTRYEVDHIIPLTNNLVCGLHTAANLQVISQSKNSAKGNVFTCYTQHATTGEITSLTEFSSGVKYTKPPKKRRGRAVKAKTKQKLAVKQRKNAINKVKALKNRSKLVKKGVKQPKNTQKLYKKPQK